MTPHQRTLASLRDGFGGDSLRRKSVGGGRYACGCYWRQANGTDEGFGDVLVLCRFHNHHSSLDLAEFRNLKAREGRR
jgi:hypothetical protein